MVNVGGVAGDQLRSFVERIERLEEEKANIAADIREVFAEAKGTGFDIKAMRGILKLRKMEAAERDEQEHMLDLYKRAIGMLPLLDVEPEETVEAAISLVANVDNYSDFDDDYLKAQALVKEKNKVSSSMIQRNLKLGYNKASMLIDSLEKDGLVTAPDEAGKRSVIT